MKMGMRRGGVLAVGALALLAACSGGGDGPPPPPPTTGALTVVNHHCIPIDALYLVPTGSPSWGTNQLTASVAPGASFPLSNIPPGSYDVMAVAADGVAWENDGIAIVAGATYPFPFAMPAGTGCLEVVNHSADTIGYLYAPVSPYGCTSNSWGANQLGDPIFPGGTFTLSNVPAGYYDLAADGTALSWEACGAYVADGQITPWPLGSY